jgi:hypothetical protein
MFAPGLGRATSEVLEMSLDVAFHGYGTHAICRYTGRFMLRPLLLLVHEIGTYCARQRQRRIIVDVRDSPGTLSVIDQYEHGVQTARSAIRGIRVAVVARADQAQPDRLWETIARNRGLTARIVADPAEALEWILDESAQPVRASGAYRPTSAVA